MKMHDKIYHRYAKNESEIFDENPVFGSGFHATNQYYHECPNCQPAKTRGNKKKIKMLVKNGGWYDIIVKAR